MILFHFDKDGRNLSGVPAFLGRVWAWRPLSDMIFFEFFEMAMWLEMGVFAYF
jgi:hypothetical protein